MPTAEELLRGSDANILEIDLDSRKIDIPSTVQNLGVESDDQAKRLYFRVRRHYFDNDLSNYVFRVNYMNAGGQGDVYVVKDKHNSEDGEFITFSWEIERFAFIYKGNVTFIVCMKELSFEGEVLKEVNTTVASLPVLKGLETGEAIIQKDPELLEKILLRLDRTEDTIANHEDRIDTHEHGIQDHDRRLDRLESAKPPTDPEFNSINLIPSDEDNEGVYLYGSKDPVSGITVLEIRGNEQDEDVHLRGIAAPTSPQDVATKEYVDEVAASNSSTHGSMTLLGPNDEGIYMSGYTEPDGQAVFELRATSDDRPVKIIGAELPADPTFESVNVRPSEDDGVALTGYMEDDTPVLELRGTHGDECVRVLGLVDPTEPGDVATKKYVDENPVKANVTEVATYITPEMYGAKGDGITDDSNAIQTAIDNAGRENIVYLSSKTYLINSTLNFSGRYTQFRCDGTIMYTGADCAIRSDGDNQNIYINDISANNGTGIRVDAKEKKVTQNDYTINRLKAGVYGIHLSVPSDALADVDTGITYCDFRLGQVEVKAPNSDLTKETVCFFAECQKAKGYINENNVWATKFSGAKIGVKLYSSPNCSVTGGYGVNDTVFHTGSFEGLKGSGSDGCMIEFNQTTGNEFKRFRGTLPENTIAKSLVFKGLCQRNTVYTNRLTLSEIDYSELEASRKSSNNTFHCSDFKLPSTYGVNGSEVVTLNHLGFSYHSNMDKVFSVVNGTIGEDLLLDPKYFNGEIPEHIIIKSDATDLKGKSLIIGEIFTSKYSSAKGIPITIYCQSDKSAPKYLVDTTGNVVVDNSNGEMVGKYIAIQCLGLAQQSDSNTLLNKYVWDVVVVGENPLTLRKSINEKLDASALPTAIDTALAQAKTSGEFDGKDGVDGQDGYTPQKGVDYFDGTPGKDGSNGVSATHSWDGTVLTITSASGTSSADLKGEPGSSGKDGSAGADGNGIKSALLNADYTLTLTFDDGTSYTTPSIRGATGAPGSDGKDGSAGSPGVNGEDGVGIASIKQTTTSTADGGNNVFTVTLTNGTSATFTVKNGSKGSTGEAGSDGKDGTSVTVKSVSESEADGGSNVVTFSDGKTVTIKNGSKGGTGDKGADGKTPVRGTDYWTESDKIEILNDVSASMIYVEPQKVAFTISKSCVGNPSGKVEGSSDHYRTDYIDLSGYDTIEFYGKCTNSKYSLAFFDSGKTIMSDVSVVGAGTALTTRTMQIPNGAAYAIGSVYMGSSVDATEEKYYVYVSSSASNPVVEAIAKIKKSLYSFDGKKVMFFGDSITYDESMYVANLLKSTGMVRIANFALNGAVLNNYSDTEMDGNPVASEHSNSVPNQVQKLLNSVSSYDVPDVVIISAATNGGTTEKDYDEAQYTNDDGTYTELDAVDLTTFSGAMRWTYEKLVECYPDAKIFFATPIQTYGGSSRTFAILSAKAECIRQNCERLSTPCIDAFRKSGIYGRYEASSTNGKYLKDGLHPNSAGAVVLAKCYHRELANALID